MVFKGMKQKYILVLDTEYDNMVLIQCAGLLFKRIDDNDIYQLAVSFNTYVRKETVGYYANKYTGITAEFLKENGVPVEDFVNQYEAIFEGIDPNDVVFVSHGTRNDRRVLSSAGVKFSPGHSYCTYKNGKRLLKRESQVALGDIAAEGGFQLNGSHNAYYDAVATASALSFLKKLEWELDK